MEDLDALIMRHFLSVSRRCDWLVLGRVSELDVTEGVVGDILDEDPSDFEDAFPLVLGPDLAARVIIDSREHLGHPTEMTASIDTEQEIDRPGLVRLVEGTIQTLIAQISTSPDLVLERFVDILLRVRLDDKESSRGRGGIEVSGVVTFLARELLDVGVVGAGQAGRVGSHEGHRLGHVHHTWPSHRPKPTNDRRGEDVWGGATQAAQAR